MNVYAWSHPSKRAQLAAVKRVVRNLKKEREEASVFACARMDADPHCVAVLTDQREGWVEDRLRPGGVSVVLATDEKNALLNRRKRVRAQQPEGDLIVTHDEGGGYLYEDGRMGPW